MAVYGENAFWATGENLKQPACPRVSSHTSSTDAAAKRYPLHANMLPVLPVLTAAGITSYFSPRWLFELHCVERLFHLSDLKSPSQLLLLNKSSSGGPWKSNQHPLTRSKENRKSSTSASSVSREEDRRRNRARLSQVTEEDAVFTLNPFALSQFVVKAANVLFFKISRADSYPPE